MAIFVGQILKPSYYSIYTCIASILLQTLRGHMEDVLDLSWSADSLQLASGSVDNKLLIWDVSKGKCSCILSDHKGFVQGVTWDPMGQYVATASSDR